MVATEVDGTPGIMVPAEDPPTTTQISVIKGGDGPKLKADDEVVTHYSLWTWPTTVGDDPTTVSSTWESKTANNIVLQEGLPKGLLDSLIGQRIGSQVLLVLAPGDDSFTADSAPAGADATYIFVFDILGIQK